VEGTLREGVIGLEEFEVDRVSRVGKDESGSIGKDVCTSYLNL